MHKLVLEKMRDDLRNELIERGRIIAPSTEALLKQKIEALDFALDQLDGKETEPASHTAEPWFLDDTGRVILGGPNRFAVASTEWEGSAVEVADAERIVLCVNACAGIPNEILKDVWQVEIICNTGNDTFTKFST